MEADRLDASGASKVTASEKGQSFLIENILRKTSTNRPSKSQSVSGTCGLQKSTTSPFRPYHSNRSIIRFFSGSTNEEHNPSSVATESSVAICRRPGETFPNRNALNLPWTMYMQKHFPCGTSFHSTAGSHLLCRLCLVPGNVQSPLTSTRCRKGGQIRFTSEQTTQLEAHFANNSKYLAPNERRNLARILKLSERQVKTWFQNRRAKWRRVSQECIELKVENHKSV